ncbi:hypothetical protein D623_10003524 [Myotis brandtii]|uniref:Uncharacterized protein n=1 Tax=Myotis brandtii TaxID=109478 RepID=S7MNS8_MYOBR|nr:hypothetical protein D623_10003524 [Myotis brandtii]
MSVPPTDGLGVGNGMAVQLGLPRVRPAEDITEGPGELAAVAQATGVSEEGVAHASGALLPVEDR